MALARLVPALSALLVAIVVGMVVGNLRLLPRWAGAGVAWVSKPLLRAGIVVLGLQLSLSSLTQLGWGGVGVLVLTVAATFAGTLAIGRALGVSRVTRYLVATGFAICGASAVAAMSSVIDPDGESEEDVAQAIALVTVFGTVALLALPLVVPLTGFDDVQAGIWIGASVHEVAQVVAAASAVSATALAIGTIAKLARVILLAPLVAGVGAVVSWRARNATDATQAAKRPPLVPLFVLGFLAAILVRTFVPLPAMVVDGAAILSTAMLAIAMFGLGVAADLRRIARTGGRATILALLSTLIAVAVSFAAIHVLT